MKTRWIGVAATALVVAAGPAWAGSSGTSAAKGETPGGKRAAELTASAWAALGKGEAATAVRDAEVAAMLLPQDAGARALLGRAYLAAGRFVSAETAFSDALTLDPAIARAAVNRALAQIALGKETAARASLAMAEGLAPEADIGLAQALLGDADAARSRLDSAARAPGADARTRQNLGLAYALEGRWNDAVAVVQQDVPADQIPQRLRRWAMIAQMKSDPAMQVGAILGVLPAADGGQPAALALAAPMPAQAPVAMAAASPAPLPAPAEPMVLAEADAVQSAPQSALAPVRPIVHAGDGSVVTQISHEPPPLAALVPVASPVPAMAAPAPQRVAASAPEPLDAPKAVAWAGPPRMRSAQGKPAPARWTEAKLVKPVAIAKPATPKPLLLASHISLKPAPAKDVGGSWAVQLGAFSSAQRTEIAWGKLTGKAAYMSAYTPTGSGKRWGKTMIYRLSVSGLATRQDAVKLCVRIRASGGACFVRGARGDRPMQWASRPRADEAA